MIAFEIDGLYQYDGAGEFLRWLQRKTDLVLVTRLRDNEKERAKKWLFDEHITYNEAERVPDEAVYYIDPFDENFPEGGADGSPDWETLKYWIEDILREADEPTHKLTGIDRDMWVAKKTMRIEAAMQKTRKKRVCGASDNRDLWDKIRDAERIMDDMENRLAALEGERVEKWKIKSKAVRSMIDKNIADKRSAKKKAGGAADTPTQINAMTKAHDVCSNFWKQGV